MSLSNILLIPGMGQMSFRDALLDLAPYSPRLAYNFIDPANSLFQGNTLMPVTSATNPVGLVIDQTQGGLGNLGAETTTNGQFTDNVTGWANVDAARGTVTWVAGKLRLTTAASSAEYRVLTTQAITTVAGRRYLVSSVSNNVSGTHQSRVIVGTSSGTSDLGGSVAYVSDGTERKIYFTAAGTTTHIGMQISTNSPNLATDWDYISVREIPGNHATASSDAKRPLFARYPATGRRNLLTYSEDISNAVWAKNNLTPTTTTSMAVASGVNFSTLFSGVYTPGVSIRLVSPLFTVTNVPYTYQAEVRATGLTHLQLRSSNAATLSSGGDIQAIVKLSDASVLNHNATTVETELLADGWVRVKMTHTPAAGNRYFGLWAWNETSITTTGTETIQARNQQVEVGGPTNYQKVVTSADITEAGVRDVYASLFDGADDCLQVSGFDLSNTDKVTVIAGVRKLSDAATGFICELGTGAGGSTSGTFGLVAPSLGGANSYRFASGGTGTSRAAGTGVFAAAPDTSHLAGISDISAPLVVLRRNGSIVESVALSQGTGNFSNQTLNIGGRNNSATLPFNGYIHYLFICGAIVPDSVLTKIYRGLGPRIGLTV